MEKNSDSESRLRAIIDNAIDGIITIDRAGIIESVNPAAANIFGYSPQEVIGKNVKILMPEPDSNNHDEYLGNYHKTDLAMIIGIGREVMGRKKDGKVFPFLLGISEVKLEDRIIYTGFIHDITEQKKAEINLRESAEKIKKLNIDLEQRVEERTSQLAEAIMSLERTNAYLEKNINEVTYVEKALRETQRLYSAMASNFPNGTISVLDKDLNYIFIDGTELKNSKVLSSSLIGTNAPYLFSTSTERQHFHEEIRKVFHGEGVKFDVEFQDKFYSVVAVPINDDKGNVNNVLVVKQNITEQKKAEAEVLRALEKEKELNELKSRFVTMASHEFRTPLSAILSSASLISKYKELIDDHRRDKHIHRIKNSVNNLTGILNDFLSLSKLEEGSVNNNPSDIQLKEFCEEIVEEMQSVVKEGQKVEYKNEGIKNHVHLDKQMLKNVIINLLSNAIKYSPENSIVDFSTELSETYFTIKVGDKGIGISEEDQAHLFTRFFRGHNVSNIQGTGLGLNIVKRYAEMMNGNIEFKSKLNEGTSFIVTLPV